MKRLNLATARVWVGASLLALASAVSAPEVLGQAICAAAKLELGQEAALEREGFTARLSMTNNLGDLPLSNMRVDVIILDADGRATSDRFFVAVTALEGVADVAGTGVVQPAGTAKASWLIVPTAGAGGTNPAGVRYTAQARMTFHTGGVPRVVTTFPVAITVKPQPLLQLEYVLPFEVFGDEPLTQVVESTRPFPLGLRVSNVGAGMAKHFTVESGQPKIVENEQGLAIDFSLLGTWVGSKALPDNTFLINFGDIPPGGASQAAWSMVSSLSGRFTEFTSTFTHAAELGGALTSLIQSATTYTLVKDVLVDLPGRDAQFDFLVNVTTPRERLEADFRLGIEPRPEFLMESDKPGLTPIVEVPGQLVGTPSGTGSVLNYRFLTAVATGTWVHSSVPLPSGDSAPLVSVTRADGKTVSTRNAWVSRHFDKDARAYSYFLHVLDYTGQTPADYAMAFDATSLDVPPDAIADLTAAPAASGGLELSWTASGEDGSAGAIFGGRYALFVTTDSFLAPSVPAALVNFATSTNAGAAQRFRLDGLNGNATYFIAVFLADASGRYSGASNRAEAQTHAHPPRNVQTLSIAATAFALAWDTSHNAPGTQYQVRLSSGAGLVLAETPFTADLSSIAYAGLDANETYFVAALERNGASALTPAVTIATFTTLALPPGTTSPAFLAVTTDSVVAQWLADGNPPDTEFLSELSTSASRAPVFAESGWVRAFNFTFAGLPPGTAFYGRVKARSRTLVETSFADLGPVKTAPIDALPPRTELVVGAPSFGGAPVFISSTASLSLFAVDDKLEVGDGVGVGAAQTFLSVDVSSFAVVSGTFSLVAEGTHTLSFFSVDLAGNTESASSATLAADWTPPIALLAVSSPAFHTAAGLVVSSQAVFSLSSADPVSNGAASGVKDIFVTAATATFSVYGGTFTLSGVDGAKTVEFFSRDNVLNVSLVTSTTAFLDGTPPVTSLVVLGGLQFPGPDASSFYASSDTRLALTGADPVVNGAAAGLALTRFQDNGGEFSAFDSPLGFSEGRHELGYQSRDNVQNLEVLRGNTVLVDATAPVTAASIGSPRFAAQDGTVYITPASPVVFAAADPELPRLAGAAATAGSGVSCVEVAVGTAAFVAYTSTLTFAEGRHTVRFRAVDNVGNVEATRELALRSDATPPQTSLALSGGRQAPGPDASSFYASSDTRLSLPAADPAVNDAASGVAMTQFQDNNGVFQAFAATFTLAEGSHLLAYQSRDNVDNLEVSRSTTALVDATAPVSAAGIGAPLFVAADGTRYVTPLTPVALSAVDPVVGGVASGVSRIEADIDGAGFVAYVSTLTFAEGRHTVLFRAVDRVGNVEAAQTLQLQSDSTPPITSLAPSGALFASGGRGFAPASFTYSLPAQDPAVNAVASGAAETLFRVDAGSFTRHVSTFNLAEGVRRVDFQSADNVGNLEPLKSAAVFVDATPPLSSLAIGIPQFDPGNGQPTFVAAATLLMLSAQDPVAQEVASGVRLISFQRGSDALSAYTAPFGLGSADGLKTVGYFAADNVGNPEVFRSTTVALDNSAPLTALAVLGGRRFPGSDVSAFYASSDTRFALPAADPMINGVASGLTLTRYQDNGAALQSFTVPFGLAEGSHLLAYQSQDRVQNLEVPRSTTVLIDATPPISSVVIGAPTFTTSDGTIYITPATPVTLSAADPSLPTGQPGSGVSRIEVAIDGGNYSAYSSALTFAEGRHTILYRAVDNVVNVEVFHTLQVRSDATPPASSLVIGTPQFQLPSVLLVSTRTPFSIASVDPIVNNVASGVKDTQHRVSDLVPSPSAFSAFTAPFMMAGADASKFIEFFSRDNVLNAEVVRSSTVLLDSTPPEIALLSPASCGAGICRVLKGKFPVLGTARDTHFGDYRLEYAAGQDAATGFVLISSGTLAVSSGALGTWDATALSGWLTLRLTAADLVANPAVVSLNVFVGDPGQSLVLGNHEVFDMPEGVAAGGDGKIYVADRNNDRIAVFSSTGALLASLGGRKNDDDDDDKHKKSTATLRLNKPSGVAVDAAGNIYVADTNRDRVLKLSTDGQVLLTLGRREREHENEHASLPGQFHHPAGVAVDAASNIYVADTENRRVQVFNSTGAFSFQFNLPPVPTGLGDDEEGEDDDEDGRVQLGKPSGIAVDAAGQIYVADSKGGRALKFSAAGQLLLTIPIPSDKPGKFGQPFGVAVSTGGDCLLVSDRKTSRILKFDFLGNSNLLFGNKGKIKDDEDAPVVRSAIVFKKPMGLALDAQGSLFVADRNNDRIQKLGLPTGQAPLVVPPSKPEDDHIARDVVDVEDGGKIERRDRAAVDIPAGAVAVDLKISVSTPAFSVVDDSNRRRAAEDAKLKAASPPVEYGPEGTKFRGSVTLTLPYSPELLALQKIAAADLKVRYWNRGKSEWEDLESVVDPKTRTVKAKTTHFSLYQVFSGTVSAAAIAPLAADATFTFHDAYAFPNPVRGAGAVTIRMQTGLADSVEVRVYDVSGRKIHSSSNFSLNPSLDDGNGKGQQYTYDHVWDVSGVGSGIYQYVITAKKAGHSDIHKTGRVGVVK